MAAKLSVIANKVRIVVGNKLKGRVNPESTVLPKLSFLTFCQFPKSYFVWGVERKRLYCFSKTLPIYEIVFYEGVTGLSL
jgi:hypothetical protein